MSIKVIPGKKYSGNMRAAHNAENEITARNARRLGKKKKK
jgi:hypothetical protein